MLQPVKPRTAWASSESPYGPDDTWSQLEAQYAARMWQARNNQKKRRWWSKVVWMLFVVGYCQFYFEQRGVLLEEIRVLREQPVPEACLSTFGTSSVSWGMRFQLLVMPDHRKEECHAYMAEVNQLAWPNPLSVLAEFLSQLAVLPVVRVMQAIGEGLYGILRHHGTLVQSFMVVGVPLGLFAVWLKVHRPSIDHRETPQQVMERNF